jgi:SAM-dependent methyltransferase
LTAGLEDRVSAEESRMMEVYAHRGHATARDSWASAGHAFMLAQRDWKVLHFLRTFGFMPLADRSILDVGCGTGSFLRDFLRWGANPARMVGVDLRPAVLDIARRSLPADVELLCESATALPFRDASVDLVLQASVLSSIKDPAVRMRVAAEMMRVVRPGGAIVWFDFRYNNPWNPNVWGMTRKDITGLFPGAKISLRSACLAPVFSRPIAGRSWIAASLLSLIPPLRSHYVGAIRPA